MENTPYLYETLLRVLGQHSNWLDLRHRKTLAWMMVGLICAKTVSLGAWTPFVVSQAPVCTQEIVRRIYLTFSPLLSTPLLFVIVAIGVSFRTTYLVVAPFGWVW